MPALICGLVCLAAADTAVAAPPPTTATQMYEPGRIVAIDLTLSPESIEALEKDPEGAYQSGTFSLAQTDGSPGAVGEFTAPLNVGIRLKGGVGSFRDLTEKAAFKIKFDAFVEGQTFLGLQKMTLNNMVQDPSMVREARAYESFRALGVAAPNTGYAFLKVNGEVYGTYLNLETMDQLALEKRFGAFGSPQHLYEGEYGDDVTPELEKGLEVDEGSKKKREDLEALVTAVDGGSAGWLGRVGEHADLGEMARMWAVEKYIGHWDGYSGFKSTPEHPEPNNYYLYSDAAGRFQMLPWGTDQTWDERLDFDGTGGVLFDDCLADGGCAAIYRSAAEEVLAKLPNLKLSTTARCAAEALLPFQQAEREAATATRIPNKAGFVAERVQADRVFMESRATELAKWLGVPAPPVDHGEHPCVEPERVTPAPPRAVDNSVELGRITIARGILSAHLTAASSGSVELRAGIRTRFGPRRACRSRRTQISAGFTRLSCRLNRGARRLLAAHAGRLAVAALFTAVDGAHSSDLRHIAVGSRGHTRR